MARLGFLDLRIVSRHERQMTEQREQALKSLAEADRALGNSPVGTPELQLGEVIMVPVPDADFFDKHINRIYNLRGGDVQDITRDAFEQLMRCVGRREPFTDPRAGDHYIDLKRSAELQGREPEFLEMDAIADYRGSLQQIIDGSADFDEFMLKFRFQTEIWGQKLPFKARNIFFDNTRDSPNFPRMICEKFGGDAEKAVAEYVLLNTNRQVFEDLRLVTLDDKGMMTDTTLSDEKPYVEFHAAHYLAASKHYSEQYIKKPKKASRKQADIEKRILHGDFREEDILLGVDAYISRLLDVPSYRTGIAIDDTEDGKGVALGMLDDGKDLFSTVVAFDSGFLNPVRKIHKNYAKSGAKVSWVDDFCFPYR